MENEYDSYDDSYDDGADFDLSGEIETDGGVDDTVEGEIDAVAALIAGNPEKADALAAHREKTGATSKAARQSINLDPNGHKVWHRSTPPEPEPESAEAPETIYHSQVKEAGTYAASEWQAAHDENERLNDLFASGQISAEDHYRLSYEQGQRAAAAKELMYQTRINELMHGKQQDAVHKQLEETLGEAWSPERRRETMKDLVEWARSKNLSDDLLSGIESADEAKALYDAMDNERKLKAAQMELKAAKAMLKKQHQQLKGRRMKQRKDANIGQKNRDTLDDVVALLQENGLQR